MLENDAGVKSVALVVPNSMAYRMITESDVLKQLNEGGVENIYVLGPWAENKGNIPDFVDYRWAFDPESTGVRENISSRVLKSFFFRIRKMFGWNYANLAFRFNEIEGFRAHQLKKKLPPEKRKREAIAGNFVDSKYARLFPRSALLYNLLYKICFSSWFPKNYSIDTFFSNRQIDTVVFWHIQAALYQDYCVCAHKAKIRIVGVIGSWDRPTTKGPICPGVSRLVVNSDLMKNELVTFHDVTETDISVVGWPHLDVYKYPASFIDEAEYRNRIGLPLGGKVLLFAANSPRLGPHEPKLLVDLASYLRKGRLGENTYLIVRPHPADNAWRERFSKIADTPNIILMPAELGNISWLANILKHSAIVISTQGSITLDAVALDKPVINIAFDSLDPSSSKSVMWMYEMDHYQAVIDSGGVKLAYSMDMLVDAINDYLHDPAIDSSGRQTLRKWQFGPFDGKSSEWMTKAILEK